MIVMIIVNKFVRSEIEVSSALKWSLTKNVNVWVFKRAAFSPSPVFEPREVAEEPRNSFYSWNEKTSQGCSPSHEANGFKAAFPLLLSLYSVDRENSLRITR